MPTKPLSVLACVACGKTVLRRGQSQKYCLPCSQAAAEKRKAAWYGDHKEQQEKAAKRRRRQTMPLMQQAITQAGNLRSTSENLVWEKRQPQFLWLVRLCVPFKYRISKNFIYGFNNWHVYKRKQSKEYRDAITLAVKSALAGKKIVQNKLWISLFIEKPNHRGDAINVIDAVCDAIKDASGLDDRWFSIRHLDWKISKRDPQLLIEIGQESDEDVQACSACGNLLPLKDFHKSKGMRLGVTRQCRECLKAGRVLLKEMLALKQPSQREVDP